MFGSFGKAGFCLVLVAFASFTVVSTAHSDLVAVGVDKRQASQVASSISFAADAKGLFDDFQRAMDEYDLKRAECMALPDPAERAKCSENLRTVLERAQDLLKKLNQQADSVESKISLASNEKPINPRYMEKLDRVLASVKEMRREANKRMEDAVKSI